MSGKEYLREVRQQLDGIDAQLLDLVQQRMKIAEAVAEIKRDNNLPILDSDREKEIIDKMVTRANPAYRTPVSMLMRTVLALSRAHQRRLLLPSSQLFPPSGEAKKEDVTCAFQGIPGSWSEQALTQIFPDAKRLPVEFFVDVFAAVKSGTVDYGIVPIENSTTGAIGETYDLLRCNGCYIVGRVDLTINQCLIGPKGALISDIRRVLSHPEALKQCSAYIRERHWEEVACRNTAVAAQLVRDEDDISAAAIASPRAAQLMGLEVLASDIMNTAGNRTSFIVVAAQPLYDESCNRISVTFATEHRSGALCEALMPFHAQGINLVRIESRPGAQDSYRFFAELESNILLEDTQNALNQAAEACAYFEVLGCYSLSK